MNVTRFAVALCSMLLASFALPAAAWNRSPATQFATLPAGTAHPEGIAADARGNLYVADFDVSRPTTAPGNIVVFDHNGRWLRTFQITNGSALLLGIAFNPVTGDLLVCDLGNQQILKVDPQSGAASVFAPIPGGGGGPNALAFDAAGNVYISDSFQATIWRTPPGGGVPVAWVSDPLLGTSGVPPFGANGLAFNRAASALFVANTGNDTVVRIPLPGGPSGTPGAPEVFVNSINGADGLMLDADDNLWVAANQADEIVVVNPERPRHRQARRFRRHRCAWRAGGTAVPGEPRDGEGFHLRDQSVARSARLRPAAGRRFAMGGRRHAAYDRAHPCASAAGARVLIAGNPVGAGVAAPTGCSA